MNPGDRIWVGERAYNLLRPLGHGKGGYSYLVDDEAGRQVVVKQIHHEPCSYYTFGDKLGAELHDYERLRAAGIPVPELLAVDRDGERLVKAYVDGPTIFELVRDGERLVKAYVEGPTIFELVRDGADMAPYLDQVRAMAAQARAAGLNIDYFPTNFVVEDGRLWYIDYECNEYMDQWSFENWGVRYWSRTPELEAYLSQQEGGSG
jgi:hypothetical protein